MISVRLVDRGYNVSAIVADYGQGDREVHNGVKFVKGVPEDISGPLSVLSALWRLAYTVSARSADLLLVRGAPRLVASAYLISKSLGKRLVFRVANDSDVDPAYLKERYPSAFWLVYRLAVRWSDEVIAQTKRQKHLLEEHFSVEADVIPNGYDLPHSEKLISHEKRDHIVWVGSSEPNKKNPRLFLRLADNLPSLSFTMISQPIAGRKSFHCQLQQEAESIDNLRFVGPVPPDEVHDYYKTAMLLVNTSNYEGFPNTFLEAWRYETPIASLYFDLNGLLEERCGGMCAGSMENLVAMVSEIASDASRREDLGRSGRKYMKQKFSLTSVVDLYEEAFGTALR